jgi:hypothetical protein
MTERAPRPPATPRTPARTPARAQLAPCLALGLLCGCGASEPAAPPGAGTLDLVDEAQQRGLLYRNVSGEAHKPTVLEANGPGVALLDLHGDGDLDLVFSQGVESLSALLAGPGADLEIWDNSGAARFERAPGPGLAGWWTGLASGDLDGDGRADLVAAAYGGLESLLQRPTGALVVVPNSGLMPDEQQAPGARISPGAERRRGEIPWWSTSLALFDADRDGWLDLYACQYLELDPLAPPRGQLGEGALAVRCEWKGLEVFCGPRGMRPQPDRLLRGLGDGRFEERSAAWLQDQVPSYALGVASGDFDEDGDCDLYVANDSMPNLLWENDGSGRMRERARAAGVAVNLDGVPEAGMGIALGDVDRDARMDLALTNFSDEPTQLYLFRGEKRAGRELRYECATYAYQLAAATRPLLSWSTHLADLDADGACELFTANGHVYPQAAAHGTGTRYAQPASLWTLADGRAQALAPRAPGSLLAAPRGGRGSALGDLDGDGWNEIALACIDEPAALAFTRGGARGQRLLLRCLGPRDAGASAQKTQREPGAGALRTPRDGLGTRVRVLLADGSALGAQVHTAVGYQSASSPWLSFGLGSASAYSALEVHWPSGRVEHLPGGAAERRLVIEEGRGILSSEDLR